MCPSPRKEESLRHLSLPAVDGNAPRLNSHLILSPSITTTSIPAGDFPSLFDCGTQLPIYSEAQATHHNLRCSVTSSFSFPSPRYFEIHFDCVYLHTFDKMPISHRHLHQHRRRDILDDIDDIVHGKNPFDDGTNDDDNNGDGGSDKSSDNKGSDNKGSDNKGICYIGQHGKRVIYSNTVIY